MRNNEIFLIPKHVFPYVDTYIYNVIQMISQIKND